MSGLRWNIKLANALDERADWLRDEVRRGGDRAHLSPREEECRYLARNIRAGVSAGCGPDPLRDAAPDLLEALDWLVSCLGNGSLQNDGGFYLAKARAAIAKASGEAPLKTSRPA